MQNYGFTINISPKKRLTGLYAQRLLRPELKQPKVVQYEKLSVEDQKYATLQIFDLLKESMLTDKHFDWGNYTWEETSNGNMHIHGYFKGPDVGIGMLEQFVKPINNVYSSGPRSLCIKFTKTHTDEYFWNNKYMYKDQVVKNTINLMEIPLTYDDI